MASAMFGLELLKKTVENNIKNETDKAVVVIHWVLIENSFKCVGLGDSKTLADNENTSELLPDDWNAESPKSYNLRYVKDKNLYLAKITLSGDDILFDLISTPDLKVKSVVIPSDDVKSVDEKKIIQKVNENIVMDKKPGKTSIYTTSPVTHIFTGSDYGPPRNIFPEIGRSDLDPFAPGPPTGMIFPGPHLGNRPRLPYRFDPINPLSPGPRMGGRRTDPDPDDFFPPGGNYYM